VRVGFSRYPGNARGAVFTRHLQADAHVIDRRRLGDLAVSKLARVERNSFCDSGLRMCELLAGGFEKPLAG